MEKKSMETTVWNKAQVEELLHRVSNCMLSMKNNGMEEKFPVSLIDMQCWEWPQGVGLYGLYLYYQSSGDRNILQFLVDWFDHRLEEGVSERNVNTTAPMLTMTYLYEQTGKERYLQEIRDWTDWMMDESGLLRAGDGCFQHMITGDPNDGEILIDTLFMAVLFLARAGRLLNRQECMDEAQYQIMNHIRYLYNREEGLFYHGWNFRQNHNYGKVMWGRGNSWYTVGIMEYLRENEVPEAMKRYFLSVYRCQCEALKRYQDPEHGVWHTVINNPETYEEISASAAFLAGIMKGVRLGILPKEEFLEVVQKGTAGILPYIQEDGTVLAVSYGTPIGWNEEFYCGIPCCPMTYGQALMIILLQEMLQW
ncbi:MAG: glycoside hydrolase family 88 protein [Lachnospiraceae bacterium]|nr:glycoside hydrolase family 88 protein [Lachnospiraceae bacterium]